DYGDRATDRHGDGDDDVPSSWRARARALLNPLTLSEDAPTGAADAGAAAPAAATELIDGGPVPTRAVVRLAAALVAGLAGGVILVATAPQWWLAPDGWRLELPGLEPGRGRSSIYFGTLFLLGVLLLAGGWLGLLGHTSRRLGSSRSRLRLVVAAAVLWSLPFAVSLPQL